METRTSTYMVYSEHIHILDIYVQASKDKDQPSL